MNNEIYKNKEEGLVHLEQGMEQVKDPEIEELIDLFREPLRAVQVEEYLEGIQKRQDAMSKYLLAGGPRMLERFFAEVKLKERKENKRIKLDLSRLDLSGKILSGVYLPGANLERVTITESELVGADLTAANLNEVVALGAKLTGVIATGANFTSAVLPDADLRGGRFVGCDFTNAILTNVKIDAETNFAGSKFVGAFLDGTDLSPANKMGAIFRGVKK